MKAIKYSLLWATLLVGCTGCFKGDREKVKERVALFIQHFNWQGQAHVIDVLKNAKKATGHLGPHFQLSVRVRETHFKQVDERKQFQQNYALLRKMCPLLQVAMVAPRITKQGPKYSVKVTLEANCRHSPQDPNSQDTIFYEFFLEEIAGQWLIVQGANEDVFAQ